MLKPLMRLEEAGPATSAPPVMENPDRAAVLVSISSPVYPLAAPARIPGSADSVVVQYLIGVDGRVDWGHVTVIAASDPVFIDAVREALWSARFRPAHRGEVPTPALVRQSFRFISK
jgi:outer membrane biosynthesis protein TonB